MKLKKYKKKKKIMHRRNDGKARQRSGICMQ